MTRVSFTAPAGKYRLVMWTREENGGQRAELVGDFGSLEGAEAAAAAFPDATIYDGKARAVLQRIKGASIRVPAPATTKLATTRLLLKKRTKKGARFDPAW